MLRCQRCKARPREGRGFYCSECELLCGKCEVRPRTGSHRWCLLCRAEHQRVWRKSHPQSPEARRKESARCYNNVLLKRGKIERQPCEVAGCMGRALMRIDDYSKPREIRWICNEHRPRKRKSK